jgi:hypothetical protein
MGVSPTNKPSMEEVISFGGISRCSDMGMRSSDHIRRQPNADATQMERAMDLAQRRDDTSGQGKNLNCKLSFASFSDDEIIAKASMLGVSMGASHVDCIGAAKMIKDLEYQRALTFLNVNEIPEDNCLAVTRASILCDDLDDENVISGQEQPIQEVPKLKIKQSRKKSLMTRRRFAEVIGLKLKVISVCNGRIKRIDVE